MTNAIVTQTLRLKTDWDGTALKRVRGTSTFGLTAVKVSSGTVSYVPDPDNEEENTIFWVQNASVGTVTLTLTYPAE